MENRQNVSITSIASMKPHKVILLGDANVGKTSILNRLTIDAFD